MREGEKLEGREGQRRRRRERERERERESEREGERGKLCELLRLIEVEKLER